ncbi:hypothetical protein [Chitinophaga tropicalis]|uniref:Uncharacterized protein n=1 Tax=Chitinophaga tropicalis TaxID=2683588 RepID=A0A7K1UD86_9BACT|nr:hypothetical protein [Chitinophaga tropicalis]MVT12286.1 hypothetical protein [Chitinophaga tropicalis]
MRYFILFLAFLSMEGCVNNAIQSIKVHFFCKEANVQLNLSLPKDWIDQEKPGFLSESLLFNSRVGAIDSSSWIDVRIYQYEDTTLNDLNSLLNWQIGNDIDGNVSIKIDKHLDTTRNGKSIGVLYFTYRYEQGAWFSRRILLTKDKNIIILSITSKKDEDELNKIFENLKSELEL